VRINGVLSLLADTDFHLKICIFIISVSETCKEFLFYHLYFNPFHILFTIPLPLGKTIWIEPALHHINGRSVKVIENDIQLKGAYLIADIE